MCLNVVGKPDALSTWDGMLDLNEQDYIRDDCRRQAGKLNRICFQPVIHLMRRGLLLICVAQGTLLQL